MRIAFEPLQLLALGPADAELGGYYPTTYCIKYEVEKDVVRVSLEGMAEREAG